MNNNIITAVFSEAETNIRAETAWQYDYGQILRIQGLNLPKAVEIHFSLEETGGTSVTRIGTTKDSVTDVTIPDSMLENEGTDQNYKIYAFIYLSENNSGNTEHKITIPIKARPKPEVPGTPEEPELFRKAVEAVNEAAGRAEKAQEQAEAWTHGHEKHPECDKNNAEYYADQAKQVATKNGFCHMEIKEDGHLHLSRTENIAQSLDFKIKKGRLEVEMS